MGLKVVFRSPFENAPRHAIHLTAAATKKQASRARGGVEMCGYDFFNGL